MAGGRDATATTNHFPTKVLPVSEQASPKDNLRIEILQSAEALREVAGDWDALWRQSAVTMPTTQAEPAALWIEQFAAAQRVHLITVRHGDRMVGALPLVGRRLGRMVPIGDLSLNPWSANGELLIDKEADTGAVLGKIADAICAVPWPLLWFGMVPYQAGTWTELAEEMARRGGHVDVRHGFTIGRVSLDQPFDTFIAGRSKNLRRSIRRDLGRLEEEGPVELRLFEHLQADEVGEVMGRAFTVEDSGWKGEGGTSVLKTPGMFDFYRRQAEHFARQGRLRLAFLECGGRVVAFEMGWFGKGVYHSVKVGYDEGYRRFGPGHLLRARLIELGCADPDQHFVDFQGPLNQALRAWITETYSIGRLVVCPPRRVSRALWTGIKAARRLSHSFRHAAAWLG